MKFFKTKWIKPEHLNRIRWYIFFNSLSKDALIKIAENKIYELLQERWIEEKEIKMFIDKFKEEINDIVERNIQNWMGWRWIVNEIRWFVEKQLMKISKVSKEIEKLSSEKLFWKQKPKPLWWLDEL